MKLSPLEQKILKNIQLGVICVVMVDIAGWSHVFHPLSILITHVHVIM